MTTIACLIVGTIMLAIGLYIGRTTSGGIIHTRYATERSTGERCCHQWIYAGHRLCPKRWHRFTTRQITDASTAADNNAQDAPK